MDLENVTLTKVGRAVTVYSEKGRYDKMTNRKSFGFSFCKEGEITYIQNGVKYVSNERCAVILPKGGTYFIKSDKNSVSFVINFDCLEAFCDTVTPIPLQNAEQIRSDCKRLEKLLLFEGSRAQIFSIFYGLLHELSSDNIPFPLRGAVQRIKNDYCDTSLTNKDLADECRMSEVYFRKLFKNHFGCSPRQYIIGMRMQRAKQLLSEGGIPLSGIAEKCGFSSAYHFCRLFKQHEGMAPSEYRKANLISEI